MTTRPERESPYQISLSLNILNHLGLNLYSNTPAVLSEVVANSWDADAERVDIEIDQSAGSVVITDDGHGMTGDDVNERYLRVGYDRRKDPTTAKSPKFHRPVMGRKGIGKLSLFSIANVVELHTVKDGKVSAFRMVLGDIRDKIEAGGESAV
ncbi:MAG: ATP-binding protein, partial [Acidimicrobiia bacterium]